MGTPGEQGWEPRSPQCGAPAEASRRVGDGGDGAELEFPDSGPAQSGLIPVEKPQSKGLLLRST